MSTSQLPLFRDPADQAIDSEVDSLAELRARVPAHVLFGTSSWTFPTWGRFVYRDRYTSTADFTRRSLYEYARHPLFSVAGFDRTFYAPITEVELAAYAGLLPKSYPCVFKVWDELTMHTFPSHARYGGRAGSTNPSFLDAELFNERVVAPHAAAFAAHTKALVVEIPRAPLLSPEEFLAALEKFAAAAERTFPIAVEVRDSRFLSRRYFEALRAMRIHHVYNFWSHTPSIREQLAIVHSSVRPALSKLTIARLLLPPGANYEEAKRASYPFDRVVTVQPAMRADVQTLSQLAAERAGDLVVLVNNKAEGSAPRTIEALMRAIAQ